MSKIVKNKLPGNILNDSGKSGAHVLEKRHAQFLVLASAVRMKTLADRQAVLIQH